MAKIVLSLSPLSAEIVKLLIKQNPDVPDFEVISGHEMSEEEVKDNFSRADVVMGDYTFNQKITTDTIATSNHLKLIQQPSVGYQHIDVKACTVKGIKVANTPAPIPSAWPNIQLPGDFVCSKTCFMRIQAQSPADGSKWG